jgi:hypothetical protein
MHYKDHMHVLKNLGYDREPMGWFLRSLALKIQSQVLSISGLERCLS